MSSARKTPAARFRRARRDDAGWPGTRASDALIAGSVVALVAAPLFLRSRESWDFANSLWLMWVAGKASIAAGHPVLFTNTGFDGPFYPQFAFYAGTLFVVSGVLGQLLGVLATYIGVWVLAIGAAYTGTLWLSRQIGVRGLIAHAPALCVVTAAYYVTDIYARGDLSEFAAVSSVPPLAASALYLIRAPRWRPLPVLVFALSGVVLLGNHNLTLIWTVTLGAVALLALWLAAGRPQQLPYRRITIVASLALAALCVNGWFLASDLLHAQQVTVGATTTSQTGVNVYFDSVDVLLNPFRYLPHSVSSGGNPTYVRSFYVNAPVWFLAWGLLAGGLVVWRRSAPERLRRVWLATLLLVALVLFAITDPWWSSVPFPWDETQFPYRLGSYLIFAVAGLVAVAALALQRADPEKLGRRAVAGLKGSLVGVAAVSIGLCVWQQWVPSTNISYYVRPGAQLVSVHTLPHSWYAGRDFADERGPTVAVPAGRRMRIPWAKVKVTTSRAGWRPRPVRGRSRPIFMVVTTPLRYLACAMSGAWGPGRPWSSDW